MRATTVAVMALLLGACANGETAPPETPAIQCADVVAVEATPTGDGAMTFEVTVRSGDTGWDRYADRWQVVAPDGTVLAERILTHPHVDEQPFTRSQSGIVIPEGVDRVSVRARDSVAGFCGMEMTFEVPR